MSGGLDEVKKIEGQTGLQPAVRLPMRVAQLQGRTVKPHEPLAKAVRLHERPQESSSEPQKRLKLRQRMRVDGGVDYIPVEEVSKAPDPKPAVIVSKSV